MHNINAVRRVIYIRRTGFVVCKDEFRVELFAVLPDFP